MKITSFFKNYSFVILPLCSAILVVLSFPKISLDFLIWFSFVPFFISIQNSSKYKTIVSGFITGFFIALLGFTWIVNVIINFSNINIIFAILACVLYATYSSTMFIIFAFSVRFLCKYPRTYLLILIPALFTIFEYFFPAIFPWNIGASLYKQIQLIQIADITGISGITFIIMLVNSYLYLCFVEKKILVKESIIVFSIIIFIICYGFFRINEQQKITKGEKIKFLLVQPNISNEDKDNGFGNPELATRIMSKMENLSISTEKPDIVLWPETALPFVIGYHRVFTERLKAFVILNDFDMIFGGIGIEGQKEFNSAFLFSKNGEIINSYNKIKLLMFGEYIPFSDKFPFLLKLYAGSGNFDKGEKFTPMRYRNVDLIVPICYELIKPGFVRKLMAGVSNGIIINLTNDSWFGDTQEPHQHLALSIFRAVEYHVPIVRVTNTGVSAIISASGKIIQQTELFKESSLLSEVSAGTKTTFYKKHGDFFVFILIILLIVGLIVIKSKLTNHNYQS